MTKKGQAFAEVKGKAPQQVFIEELADKFKSQMDAYFRKNLSDDPIMLDWHRNFADILERGEQYPPVKKWIRPSMVGADKQAIWMHLHGYKPDTFLLDEPQDEVHTRWQAIGTVVGDMWQRQVLSAEHWTKKGKADVDFAFERVNLEGIESHGDGNYPMFEEFARKYIEIDGVPVWGTCDGILNYREIFETNCSATQVVHRIGFEVKSKQTTNASTGTYKMKCAEDKHIQQIKTYALMYDLDYYFILYQNCSKKGWTQDEETKTKYPDVRVFGIYISEEDKESHRNYLRDLWDLQTKEKPPLDPLNWTFNSHKISAIVNMTDEEYTQLSNDVSKIRHSRDMTAFEKKSAEQCLEEIRQAREEMKRAGTLELKNPMKGGN